MFIVLIHYQRSLTEIDRLMPAHVRFLETCYAAGVFLTSGRRVPRDGGVILAQAPSRTDVEAIMAHDPFVEAGAATFEIVEFRTSLHHPALAGFADAGTRVVQDVPNGN